MTKRKPRDERGAKAVQWNGGGYHAVTRGRSSAPSWVCPTHGHNGLEKPKKDRECNCPHRQER